MRDYLSDAEVVEFFHVREREREIERERERETEMGLTESESRGVRRHHLKLRNLQREADVFADVVTGTNAYYLAMRDYLRDAEVVEFFRVGERERE